jgi:hypothetical protein
MIAGTLPWSIGIGGVVAFQFLAVWIYKRGGNVWLLVALWYAMVNTTDGQYFFRLVDGQDNVRLGVIIAGSYVLMAEAVYSLDNRYIKAWRSTV